MFLNLLSKNLTSSIGWVKKNLMLAYKVGGWVKKGPKYAYVIYEWSQRKKNLVTEVTR